MPWESKTVEEKRKEFVSRAVMKEESMSALCKEYGISRPTGYKWIERYKTGEGLADRTHTPKIIPNKTAEEKEEAVLEARYLHPTWGPRKLHRYLTDKGCCELPAVSTISNILKRNGCISPEESEKHTPWRRFEMDKPNKLWQMDYKGHFGMLNESRCHPLTMLDDHSRFCLCLDAKENEQWQTTKSSICSVFRQFGMPEAILCDNGRPWGDSGKGYTPFEVWMMQLDILPMHGRPLHPQTQGKEERFHRTLKNDLLKRTPILDIAHAQDEFDAFKYCYNYERPHGALNMDVPAKFYRPSKRDFVEVASEPEYDSGKILRKVNFKGYISVNKHRYYLSEAFIGKYIEIVPSGEDSVDLCYGNFIIARIDISERLFTSRRIVRQRRNCKQSP